MPVRLASFRTGIRRALAPTAVAAAWRTALPELRDRRARGAALVAAAVAAAMLALPEAADWAGIRHAAAGLAWAPAESGATAMRGRPGLAASPSAISLFKDFRRIGYRLEDLREGTSAVPRVFIKAMPRDIRQVRSIPTRKAVFIKTLLPLVLYANEELRMIRARVTALAGKADRDLALAPGERAWLAAQYERFGVPQGELTTLLRRVDIIPPSLALAQGAEESGWGTSRFAIEGRALFGQRTYRQAPGLVPAERAAGARFKVKRFDRLLDAVRSYAQNLNTHPAYLGFRKLRSRLRAEGGGAGGLDPLRLAEALERYSARGPDYVKAIKTIIRANDLTALDGVRLEGTPEDALASGSSA